MKTKAEIKRLLDVANKQHARAMAVKFSIKAYDPERSQRPSDCNQVLLISGTTISVLSMILDNKSLKDEDVRYFLSQCG